MPRRILPLPSMRVIIFLLCGLTTTLVFGAAAPALPLDPHPVLFNTAFDSGSIGRIEKLSETEFRLHVKGQQDSRGRNRQATWFLFRMDDVAGREITLGLTSF